MFSWHSPLVILWGKCWENAAFALSGKLWKNVQENKLYTSVFVSEFFSLSPFRKTNDEQGFLCHEVNSKENKPKGQVIESQFSTVSPLESVDDV